jgi:hypothetical protein
MLISADGKAILNLPKRTLELVTCTFDDDEKAFYDALAQQTELTFNKVSRGGRAREINPSRGTHTATVYPQRTSRV